MNRPQAEDLPDTDALADDAGTRAMVDLMLGTTALLLVVLLAVGAQALRHPSSSDVSKSDAAVRQDALFAEADGPVVFAGADGVRLAGSENIVAVREISSSIRLQDIAGAGTPTLVIAPEGVEAAFHVTARLAALGVPVIRRIRLESSCRAIERVEIRPSGWSVSCRRN